MRRLLIAAGSIFALIVVLLLFSAVVFLVGGLDAVVEFQRSVSRRLVVPSISSPVCESSSPEENRSKDSGNSGKFTTPALTVAPEVKAGEGLVLRLSLYHDVAERMAAKPSDAVTEEGNESPGKSGKRRGKSGCSGFGEKLKQRASRLPMDKIKILVVVWQILTIFPSITAVDFPPIYSRFLSWISIVNFNLGTILSASCVLPVMDFYQILLLTTLSPIALAATLMVTYWVAKRKAGVGPAASVMARAAWSRHMAAGLLLTFMVNYDRADLVFSQKCSP